MSENKDPKKNSSEKEEPKPIKPTSDDDGMGESERGHTNFQSPPQFVPPIPQKQR
jgi:hypothetical protein